MRKLDKEYMLDTNMKLLKERMSDNSYAYLEFLINKKRAVGELWNKDN